MTPKVRMNRPDKTSIAVISARRGYWWIGVSNTSLFYWLAVDGIIPPTEFTKFRLGITIGNEGVDAWKTLFKEFGWYRNAGAGTGYK
jgi:hypothetical protein